MHVFNTPSSLRSQIVILKMPTPCDALATSAAVQAQFAKNVSWKRVGDTDDPENTSDDDQPTGGDNGGGETPTGGGDNQGGNGGGGDDNE